MNNQMLYRTASALVLSLALLSGCGKHDAGKAPDGAARREVTGVEVGEAEERASASSVEVSGTVRARAVVPVASRLMGAVTSLKAREGDRVAKGDLLAAIDDSDIVRKVEAAQAAHMEAVNALAAAGEQRRLTETTLDRYRKLLSERAVSQQEFDAVEAQRNAAAFDYERLTNMVARTEAGMREALVMRGYARITSPVSGIVIEKRAEAGSMAVPGMPLLLIEDTSSYLIEADIDESLARLVKVGSALDAVIEPLGKSLKGRVAEVVPSVNPASRTFVAKISVSAPGLRSGQYARITLPGEPRKGVFVPREAVIAKGQMTGVYTVGQGNIITFRPVRTGGGHNGEVEILSGLNPGEMVIIKGANTAVDGGIVK